MSVSQKVHGAESLDVNNGLASRLLRAVGYTVSEESSGSMPIVDLLAGAERAKREGLLTTEDQPYLDDLIGLAHGIQRVGGDTLNWS